MTAGTYSQKPFVHAKQYVKYVPVGFVDTHHIGVAYLAWLFGMFGAHRFFLGRPLSGLLYLCTFGLLGIGWIVDLFLIPGMVHSNRERLQVGVVDYNVAWVLFWLGGVFGLHRFYQGKWITGILYFFTGGLFLIGLIYDLFCLNVQVLEVNQEATQTMAFA